MSRQEQVLEEKTAFQRFRDLLEPSIVRGWLEPIMHTDESPTPIEGAPDFLVRRSADPLLGVELLSLTNEGKQAESARQWSAINLAQQRFEACCSQALWLSVCWSGYVSTLPVPAVAEDLFTLVFAYHDQFSDNPMKLEYCDFVWGQLISLFPKAMESQGKPELRLKALPTYVSSVTVRRAPTGMKAHWKYCPADYIPTIGASELMEEKKSKEDKVEQYLHHCQEVWLLIYYGVVRMNKRSLALEVDIELERPVGSKFDKIWLLQGTHSLRAVQIEVFGA
jgi:hypothetical protein